MSYKGGGGQAAGQGSDLHGDGLHEGGLHAGGLHGGRLHGDGSEQRWMPRHGTVRHGTAGGCKPMAHRHNSNNNNNNRGCRRRRRRVLSPVFNQLSVIRRRIETSRSIMRPFAPSSTLLHRDLLSRKSAFVVFVKLDVTIVSFLAVTSRAIQRGCSPPPVPRLLRCHYRRL